MLFFVDISLPVVLEELVLEVPVAFTGLLVVVVLVIVPVKMQFKSCHLHKPALVHMLEENVRVQFNV